MFDVLKVLQQRELFKIPYDELVETVICTKSGHLAGLFCEEIKKEWNPKIGARTEACPFHQIVFLYTLENFRVNSSCNPLDEMVQKNWFALPPVIEYYYTSLHPEYKVLPSFSADCL